MTENGFGKTADDLAQDVQDLRRPGHQQRRRADRRDHLLHQHLEPRRAARRRPAREEGGRARPDGEAARQDLARAGLARGHRVPDARPACCPTSRSSASRRRLRLHHLHRQRRPARAADRGSDRQERPGLRRGALRQPQLRGAHPPEHPRQLPRLAAAGGGLRARRVDADRPQNRAPRQIEGRQARLPRPHLADRGRGEGADEARDGPADLPQAVRGPRQRQPDVEEDLGARRPGLQLAEVDLHRRAAVLQGLLA